MRASLFAAISVLIAAGSPAQIPSVFSPPKQDLVKLSGAVDPTGRGVINATIENGWHINSAHPLDSFNVWREDVAKSFPHIDEVLKNAPETEAAFFKVKKVIE